MINCKIDGFDWDDGNREKCRKHGVPIAGIEAALLSDLRMAPDLKHSEAEQRFIAIGRNVRGRPMFIAFTFRQRGGHTFIRPIGARYMHEKEITAYETRSKAQD